MRTKVRAALIKIIGVLAALLLITLPITGIMGVRYGADYYGKKRAAIVDNCVVMSVVESPKETLLVVRLPQTFDNPMPDWSLRVVRAYGKREKDKPDIEEGDTVVCGFPEKKKGFVVW